METHGRVLRNLGAQVSCALQEVGAQIKYHAKQATTELGINLDGIKTPFCAGMASDVSCSFLPAPSAKRASQTGVKTYGTQRFGFDVRFHEQEMGVVVVSVSGVDPAACSFSWRRRLHSYETRLDHVTGPRYRLTADDVGSTVVVTCSLRGLAETAEAEVGPIDIDVRSKRQIQEALINNSARHQLCLVEVNGERVSAHADFRQVVLYVLSEELSLSPEDNLGFAWRNRCRFGTDYPRVTLDLEDELKFWLQFDADLRFGLRVYNAPQRDLVALVLRVFHSRVLLNSSFENNSLELTRDGRLDQLVNPKTLSLDALVQRLSVDLSALIVENARLAADLQRAKQEKNYLELEMKSTIQVFQQQVAIHEEAPKRAGDAARNSPGSMELSRQTTTASGASDSEHAGDDSQTLYMELVNRNAMLTEKLNLLTHDNNSLQEQLGREVAEKNRFEKQAKCALKDLEKARAENEQLEAKMGELRNKLRKLSLMDAKV